MRYGWVPDRPDRRDLKLSHVSSLVTASLPPHVDFSDYGPVIYDQGELGSCTANAIGAAIQYDQIKQKEKSFQPSRLFIYYNERAMEGTVHSDSGAAIRDGIKSVNRIGVCPEWMWPYDLTRFDVKPQQRCYTNAPLGRALRYQAVTQDVAQLRAALASKTPVVFGFTVYRSFESDEVAATGVLNMPGRHESVVGGHAVMLVGYDDATRRFKVRNSWGEGWGQRGYFTMPYDYVTHPDLADDFWVINQVA
jgi:C1A family cysteine protease